MIYILHRQNDDKIILRLPTIDLTKEQRDKVLRNVAFHVDNYQQTSVRSVNPYDNSGMRSESQNIVTDSGKRTTTVSYSGDPDSATSTTSSSTTATNTGTETTIHSGSRSGNIGVTTTQQMLESELELAQKMDLFKIIELDVAAKIFIGVW